MTELFLDVLNASYAASFVVLAVILARPLLKKAPRWMVCALWALVAVRLLVPGIFETSFSLVPSREIIPPQSLYDAAPQIQSGFDSIDKAVNPVYSESLRPAPGGQCQPAAGVAGGVCQCVVPWRAGYGPLGTGQLHPGPAAAAGAGPRRGEHLPLRQHRLPFHLRTLPAHDLPAQHSGRGGAAACDRP